METVPSARYDLRPKKQLTKDLAFHDISDVNGIYRVRHKSVNTPLSHERLVGGLQDGGRGTHVTHFVQLYPQPLYTASQVRTTCRSWDEGVLTDLCLTGVSIDLCLTLYIKHFNARTYKGHYVNK